MIEWENQYLELDLGLSDILLATTATSNLLRFLDLRSDRLKQQSSQRLEKSVTSKAYAHLH